MKYLPLAAITIAPLLAQGVWERRAPYPVQATEVSSAVINGKVYSLCGILPNAQNTSTLYIYDPYRDEWSEGPPVPIPGGGDHCNVASANGKLYVLGAIRVGTSFVDGNTYEFDPGTSQWTTVGRMGDPRGASGVAAVGSRIYVAGGLNPTLPTSTLEVFDTQSRQWTRLPNMPTARDHLTAQAINGRVYAIAGRTGGTNLTANEEFDPSTNAWRSRTPIPTARGGLGSGTLRNRIQVFGGEGPSGRPEQTFEQHEEYDPVSNTWGMLALMSTPRHGLYGATFDGRIFTPAGGPQIGGTFSNAHDAFFLPLPSAPSITGISNAASFRTESSPGAIMALFGDNLSQGEQQATRFPIATQMNQTVVRVNGTAVPLLYVGPRQVNFQIPYNVVPGPLNVTVSHAGSLSSIFSAIDITAASPAVFTTNGSGTGQGAVVIAGTGLLATALPNGRPARRGEILEIYCTGLGRLDFPPATGQPAPSARPAVTLETPEVTIGGVAAEVTFSGLTPGTLGLYQINARVAEPTPRGDVLPLIVRIGGRTSNTVSVSVRE